MAESAIGAKRVVPAEYRGQGIQPVELGTVQVTEPFAAETDEHRGLIHLTDAAHGGSVPTMQPTEGGLTAESHRLVGVLGFPCHLRLSLAADRLFAARYDSGEVVTISLRDGWPTAVATRDRLPFRRPGLGLDEARQEVAHAHHVTVAGERMIVTDVGSDAVILLSRNGHRDTDVARHARLLPSAGPRHLVLDDEGYVWTTDELSATVTRFVFELLHAGGGFTVGERVVSSEVRLPAGVRTFPGDVALTPSGRAVVVTNWGADTLSRIEARDGRLVITAEIPCGGRWPANLLRQGAHLWVANRDTGTLARFSFTGDALNPTPVSVRVERPIAILPWPEPPGGDDGPADAAVSVDA